MEKNESGRTMVEILSVLAIIGILSVSGILWYMVAMQHHKIDEILNVLRIKTVEINSAMQGKTFSSSEDLDRLLVGYKTHVAGYMLSFHASPDNDGFVTDITHTSGKPIKGKMCRELIRKMAEQHFVSDVDFTLKDEEKDDGTVGDLTVRLKGQYIDLNAVCGD